MRTNILPQKHATCMPKAQPADILGGAKWKWLQLVVSPNN